MIAFNSFDEILDYAIQREIEAQEFYNEMAANAKLAHIRPVFEGFAREEQIHEKRLRAIKEGNRQFPAPAKIQSLRIAEYRQPVTQSPDMSYDKVLLLAMQREKSAFKLYSDLAEMSGDAELSKMFLALAQEEAKHKLRFELEYDREYMGEN
jgi:rubrerythrin